jgi:DNA-binding transcriptional MerR regulator
MRIGELAKASGLSPDTLRYYEKKRLLQSAHRTDSGQRLYSPEAAERVRIIRSALALGFSVAELQEIFDIRDSGRTPCSRVYELATARLEELDVVLQQWQSIHARLSITLNDWKRDLRKTPKGKRAGLLESFANAYPQSAHELSPLLSPGLRKRNK